MTYPTKAICPILLEDMRKVAVERKGDTNFFTSDDIKNCMKKVIPVDLQQTIKVDDELEIKAYYAGHVLGAAMFHVRVGDETVVYTGDYNMTPDRHLGAAWIDKCRPDLLITESTYATTIRGSKRTREHDFLKKIHDCVRGGGKVLIPVFALGRAQELCILVEAYWDRMDDLRHKVPVYFSAGLTERANEYYKLFINWTNEHIKDTFVDRNMFDFKYIEAFQPHFVDEPGPMVLFASPGMLHAGTSLQVFKKWCHDPKNMVILPGYCVAGTVGAKVLAGEKSIQIDPYTRVEVNLQVKNLSFSAHADAKGIMQLVRMCEPENVMLVHGEKSKMAILKKQLEGEMGVPTFDPANCEMVHIGVKPKAKGALMSGGLARNAWDATAKRIPLEQFSVGKSNYLSTELSPMKASFVGLLIGKPGEPLHIVPRAKDDYTPDQRITFSIKKHITFLPPSIQVKPTPAVHILGKLFTALQLYIPQTIVRYHASKVEPGRADRVSIESINKGKGPLYVYVQMAKAPEWAVLVGWEAGGEDTAGRVLAVVEAIVK